MPDATPDPNPLQNGLPPTKRPRKPQYYMMMQAVAIALDLKRRGEI
jgi:hypothetical protein